MKPGDELVLDIASINSEGEGVSRHGEEHFVVFVPGALPGERAHCRIVRASKKYAVAKVLSIEEAAPGRVLPRCPSYRVCGGCQLQHASYPMQLEMKAQILRDALRRIGQIDYRGEIRCAPSPSEWGYRNKTTLPVGRGAGRGAPLVCGYYERRTHNVVPFQECAVLAPALERLVSRTIRALAEGGFKGYNESSGSGDIRYLAARAGGMPGAEEILAGIVTPREPDRRQLGRLRQICQSLSSKEPALAGSVLNIKTTADNFIWGPVFRSLHGRKSISQQLGDYRFQTDISAFFQINRAQTEALFSHVRETAERSGASSVLELYSGVGSLTAYLASVAGRVDAVEEWRPAVRQMKENMEANDIANVRVFSGSVEEYMQNEACAQPGQYDTVVLDPPRTGCDERVVEGILRASPQTVVYVSCNPATLARDIARLIARGDYSLAEVSAFDMFPQTAHVESVSRLVRVK